MLSCPRLNALLALVLLTLSLRAEEASRVFPLWDGKEAVASYAERVKLPATKTLDLCGGVMLELVLIPAGQFIMGSEEPTKPTKPTVTVGEANWLIVWGCMAFGGLLGLLVYRCIRTRKLSFSLRYLLLLTIASGLCVGGYARRELAIEEVRRYRTEFRAFSNLPRSEKPAHSVTLTKPFYMGKYTVTQEQYVDIMATNPSQFTGANLPVERVSWDDAVAFCAKLNEKFKDAKLQVELPTEAQWEYACRAGTRTLFYSGDLDSNLNEVGWNDSNSRNSVHPVGQLKANAFGLFDMHGNVLQWCLDFCEVTYPTAKPLQDPTGPNEGKSHVLRGGAWYYYPSYCRSANRRYDSPNFRSDSIGFRVVVSGVDF